MAYPTRPYTVTSMKMARKGSSPEQRWFSGSVRHRSGQTAPNLDRSSRAWFLSCTSKPWVLGAREGSLPVKRSSRESSHWRRRRSLVWSAMAGGGVDWWSWNLGQMTTRKRGLPMRKESPNGRANQWLTGGEQQVVLTSALGKEIEKGGSFSRCLPFIGEGETERRNRVHTSATVSRRWRNQWRWGTVPAPLFPIGVTRGCGRFETNLGHYSTGSGPIH
jgi:hypothetical protein